MHKLELKIPPVIVLLVFIGLAYLSNNYLPFLDIPPLFIEWYGYIATLGVAVIVAGVWKLKQSLTTVDPRTPEKAHHLVSGGIYSFTRNPMYLGMALVLTAAVLKFGNLSAMTLLPCFILYIHYFQIRPEERAMEKLFGKQYLEYKASVRPWL